MPTYVRIRNPIIFPSNPSRRLIPEPGTQIASPLLPRPGRYREPALDVWYSGTPGSDSSRQTLTARSLTNNTDFEARIGDEFYTDQRIALALRRSRSASAIWLRSGGFFQLSGLEPPPASVKRTLNFRSLALQLVLPLDDLPEGWSESLATLSVGDVSVFALRSGFRPFLPLGTNLLSGVTVSTGYGTLPVGMGVDLRISDATMPVPEAAVDKGRGAGSGARLVLKGTLRSLLAPGIPVLTIPTHMKVTAEIAITPDSGNLPNRLFSLSLKDFKLRPGPLEAASPSHQASVALIKSFVRSKFEDYLAGGGSGSSANGLAATLNASVLGRLNSVTIPAAVATVPPNRRVAWLFRSAANIQIAGVKGLLLQATGLWYAGAEEENLGFFPVGR